MPPSLDFDSFQQNADPYLDGLGIALTTQIPSSVQIFDASKAFSKIHNLKALPVCSIVQRKVWQTWLSLLNRKIDELFHVSGSLLNKPTRPCTLQQ